MRRIFSATLALALIALPVLTTSARADDADRSAKQSERAQRKAEARARKQAARQAKLEAQRPMKEARAYRKLEVDGDAVIANVEKLTTELTWHGDLAAARDAARASGKPVLWVQALGDLDGYL